MPKPFHLVVLAGVALPLLVHAQTFTTIYTFPSNGKAGLKPAGLLIVQGKDIYGTTEGGGASNDGTVFKVNAMTSKETVLHSFAGGADGTLPLGGVVYLNHSLWGTTIYGGSAGVGTVFKVDLQTGAETVVHSFLGGNDGENPGSALLYAGGYLYGTAAGGVNKDGTIFKIDPTTGAETVVYSFEGEPGGPTGELTFYNNLLYGLTSGPSKKKVSQGAAFALDPATNVLTVIHTFGKQGDGASPQGQLLLDDETFFGTTYAGGASGLGTIFKLDPSTGDETVLHSFDGNDGGQPLDGVISQGGTLYGTASRGSGDGQYGTVFAIDPSTGLETILHTFTDGADGAFPVCTLVALDGNLYGTTVGPLNSSQGSTVFMVTP